MSAHIIFADRKLGRAFGATGRYVLKAQDLEVALSAARSAPSPDNGRIKVLQHELREVQQQARRAQRKTKAINRFSHF